MKLFTKSEDGFTLLGVLMVLVIFSILGFSILAVTAGSVKLSIGERDDQSVYYIAEAGLVETRVDIENLVTQAFNDVNDEYQNNEKHEEKEAFLAAKSFEARFKDAANKYIAEYIADSQLNGDFTKKFDKQFDSNDFPTANILVKPEKDTDNSYLIQSMGNVGGKSRIVSQVVTVDFGHELIEEEISVEDGEKNVFKACANGYLNSATTSGTAWFGGDIILKEDSKLNLGGEGGIEGDVYSYGDISITNSAPIQGGIYSNGSINITNNMKIGKDLLALGSVSFSNTATVDGNVFSDSTITVSNNPTIKGQLYATDKINIVGQPKVTGDIVSKDIITLSNGQVKANEIISSKEVNVNNGSYSNIRQNVTSNELPLPRNGFNGLVEVSQLYQDLECTNLDDENFKPKIPDVKFKENSHDLAGDSELIEFNGSETELHINNFKYNKHDKVNIKLPRSDDDIVYSLYFNSLEMNHRDIYISGNGKLNIYVKDSLSLGKIIQEKDSSGMKRSNFDTTIYYLNDNKKSLDLSNWGNCKIESNLFMDNGNLNNNGCKVNGNIVVLGENVVTLNGNNATNGQIFYLADSDLVANGSVDVKGYVVAKNMTGNGNIKFSNPTADEGIDSDMFEKPSSPSSYTSYEYLSKTLLITGPQIEE